MRIIHGHHPGGLGWLIKRTLDNIYKLKVVYVNNRISYLLINKEYALIGVYMPSNDTSNPMNKLIMRESIKDLRNTYLKLKSEKYKVLIIGDLNTDFERKNSYDKLLIEETKSLNLKPYLYEYEQCVDHTFFKGNKKSNIDNVLAEETLDIYIKNVEIISNVPVDNKGDHHPLLLSVAIANDQLPSEVPKVKKEKRLKWTNEDQIKYYKLIEEEHKKVNCLISIYDKDSHKNLEIRTEKLIRDYQNSMKVVYNKVCDENEISSKKNIIKYRKTNKEWFVLKVDESHKNYKIALKTWQNDKTTINHNSYVFLKKIYRSIRNSQKALIENNFFKKINNEFKLKERDKNYWKSLKNTLKPRIHTNIDIEIAKESLSTLFNNRITEGSVMSEKESFVNCFKNDERDKVYDYKVSEIRLMNIIRKLNRNKSVGYSGISNEMIKYANNIYSIKILKQIIENYLNYNIKPQFFNIGIIKLLIKDLNGDHDNMSNLRPITVSDTLASILEKILLEDINNLARCKKEQLGFKSDSSCDHAVFILKETILFNRRKNKKTFACALDCSKAFDKVNRTLLYYYLITKCNPIVARGFINYYDSLKLVVYNNGKYSAMFNTTLGVKQGGPSSPRLFSLYIEELSDRLNSLNIGINIGTVKINHIKYADDVMLLANNEKELNKLLEVVSKFGLDFEVKFNPDKTQFMVFEHNKNKSKNDLVIFNNEKLERVYEMKYLGSYLEPNLSGMAHINKKIQEANGKVHAIKSVGFTSKLINTEIKINQYKTYIRPVLTYGMCNIQLKPKQIGLLQTTEANIIKRSVGLGSRGVRNTLLLRSFELESLELRFKDSKIRFLKRLMRNEFTRELLINLLNFDNEVKNDNLSLLGYLYELSDDLEQDLDDMIINLENGIDQGYSEYSEKIQSPEVLIVKEILKKTKNERYLRLVREIVMEGAKPFYMKRLLKIK